MSKYKLTYFDFNGGRGEPVRIALHAAGIDFEDDRITFEDFMQKKSSYPLNAVPVLEIDGKPITQSSALARYAGILAGLYPVDITEALYCDEVMGTIEDLTNRIAMTMGLEGDVLKQAREGLSTDWIPVYFQGLESQLKRGGGEFFADDKLTVADLSVMVTAGWFTSGQLDHIPTDIVTKNAPMLAKHMQRIAKHPVVTGYYESIA